jgi:hypothetical protein
MPFIWEVRTFPVNSPLHFPYPLNTHSSPIRWCPPWSMHLHLRRGNPLLFVRSWRKKSGPPTNIISWRPTMCTIRQGRPNRLPRCGWGHAQQGRRQQRLHWCLQRSPRPLVQPRGMPMCSHGQPWLTWREFCTWGDGRNPILVGFVLGSEVFIGGFEDFVCDSSPHFSLIW